MTNGPAGLKGVSSGLLDMIARSKEAGLAPPRFIQEQGQVKQTLFRPVMQGTPEVTGEVTPEVTIQATIQAEALRISVLNDLAVALGTPTIQVTIQVAMQVAAMLGAAAHEPQKSAVLQRAMGLQSLDHFRRAYRIPLVAAKWLAMTNPNSPNDPNQHYTVTPKGRAWLNRFKTLPKP